MAITGRGRRGPSSMNPSAVATLEALYEPRYQAKSITATTSRMVYFDSVDQLWLANTEKQFAIASPKFFEIYEINWKAVKGATLVDLALLGETGFFVLTVGSKDYLTIAMRLIPAGSYIYGFSNTATAATDFSLGYGWPSFYDRYPVWVHEEEVDPVTKTRRKTGEKLPIVLPPEQAFKVTLNFGDISTLAATRQVMVVLWGTLFREVQ